MHEDKQVCSTTDWPKGCRRYHYRASETCRFSQ